MSSIAHRQGQVETMGNVSAVEYDEKCYLCPGNARVSGASNPPYTSTYIFPNDFQAVQSNQPPFKPSTTGTLMLVILPFLFGRIN